MAKSLFVKHTIYPYTQSGEVVGSYCTSDGRPYFIVCNKDGNFIADNIRNFKRINSKKELLHL